MNNKSIELLFSPEVQDEFWGAMDPDIRALFINLQNKENWTQRYDDNPALFSKIALALLEVGSMPLNDETQELLSSLIPLITTMPLMSGVFAIHWLNSQSVNTPIGWGTFCYLEALNIANRHPDHEQYDMARAMVSRIQTVIQARAAVGLTSQWPLKST